MKEKRFVTDELYTIRHRNFLEIKNIASLFCGHRKFRYGVKTASPLSSLRTKTKITLCHIFTPQNDIVANWRVV